MTPRDIDYELCRCSDQSGLHNEIVMTSLFKLPAMKFLLVLVLMLMLASDAFAFGWRGGCGFFRHRKQTCGQNFGSFQSAATTGGCSAGGCR